MFGRSTRIMATAGVIVGSLVSGCGSSQSARQVALGHAARSTTTTTRMQATTKTTGASPTTTQTTHPGSKSPSPAPKVSTAPVATAPVATAPAPPPTTPVTTPVVTTKPAPAGYVRFVNAQAQTFSLSNGCNYVSFVIDNESNTNVAYASVTFTMDKYSSGGSWAGGGPTEGPYGVSTDVFPYSQHQYSVEVCPSVGLLLLQGEYFQISGVSGTYTWAG